MMLPPASLNRYTPAWCGRLHRRSASRGGMSLTILGAASFGGCRVQRGFYHSPRRDPRSGLVDASAGVGRVDAQGVQHWQAAAQRAEQPNDAHLVADGGQRQVAEGGVDPERPLAQAEQPVLGVDRLDRAAL